MVRSKVNWEDYIEMTKQANKLSESSDKSTEALKELKWFHEKLDKEVQEFIIKTNDTFQNNGHKMMTKFAKIT